MTRISVAVCLCLSIAVETRAQAQTATPQAYPTCTRAELQTAVDSYLAAQKAGDASKIAFAEKPAFLENMVDGKLSNVHTISVNLNPNTPSPQADDNGVILR